MTVSGEWLPRPSLPTQSPCHAPLLTSSPLSYTTAPQHTEVKATKEEMDKAQIDLALRDACAHLLIPLNK